MATCTATAARAAAGGSETLQKQPAAGVASAGTAYGGQSWALLDPAIILDDKKDEDQAAADSSTAAAFGTANDGSKVRVSLSLAEPPASSYVKLRTDADVHGKPVLLSADGHMILIRMVVARVCDDDPPFTWYEDNYFVYKARPAPAPDSGKEGRLRLLPDPAGQQSKYKDDRDGYVGHIGIACSSGSGGGMDGDQGWVVAGFRTRVVFGEVDDEDNEVGILSRFRPSTNQWDKQRLTIPFTKENADKGLFKFVWHSDDVVAFNGRMFWIDYHRGMSFCDVFAESTELHYIHLPGIEFWGQGHDYSRGRQAPRAYRTVGVSRGQLKFVNIDHELFGTKKASGFKITTWSLNMTDLEWEEDHVLVVDQLWDELPDYRESHLPQPVPKYPVVDKKDTSILHFILRGSRQSDTRAQAWIITLDMVSNKVLKSYEDPSVDDTTQIFCGTPLISCDFDHGTKPTGICGTIKVKSKTTLPSTPKSNKRKLPSPAEYNLDTTDKKIVGWPDDPSGTTSMRSGLLRRLTKDMEQEDAQQRIESWNLSDVEQRLFAEVDPLMAPDEKLARPLQDGRPSGDADMADVNAAMTRPAKFTIDELRQITDNFSHSQLIGSGGFGPVYKGVLRNGDKIAIKRFASTMTKLQDDQFEIEAQRLMGLRHPNLVRYVGYCYEMEKIPVLHHGTYVCVEELERSLCMEYMPKGSLLRHLSDETSGLDWNTRYEIIKGIWSGLHYLHEWQATPIIHMDLKPANILLDDNMVPKITDFGLSRLLGEDQTPTCTSCMGTPGYIAPEYIEKGVITKKSDIFSLGVIIIEIITGLKNYPTDETETASQQYIDLVLKNWRHRPTEARGYTTQDIGRQQVKKCIQIGLLCVKFDRVKRPTIKQIIELLERSDESYQNLGEEEAQQWFDSWKSTVLQDLFPEVQPEPDAHSRISFQEFNLEELRSRLSSWERMNSMDFQNGELPDSKHVSIVSFTGPNSKGRKLQQGRRWKEISIKGKRAVADPSPPAPEQQQQRYVGFKKMLELDDDGNGNKWHAHEYTPLLPSDNDSNMLVIADISLRVEFKEDKPLSSSSKKRLRSGAPKDAPKTPEKLPVWEDMTVSSSSTKRSRSGAPKHAPKTPVKSPLWKHMTRVHVKTADGSLRKKPWYKVKYAICHHCDKVFNADLINGTSQLLRHLGRCSCDCNCTHSQSLSPLD